MHGLGRYSLIYTAVDPSMSLYSTYLYLHELYSQGLILLRSIITVQQLKTHQGTCTIPIFSNFQPLP